MRSRSHFLPLLFWLLAVLCGFAIAPSSLAEAEPACTGAEDCAAQVAATREVARRAAVRRNRQEQRALRELLVQSAGLCQEPERYCTAGNRSGCAAQLRQTCTALANRAAHCRAQARQFCAQQRGIENCLERVGGRCPSSGKQDVDELLARYPDLTPAQKARIKQLAGQLGADQDQAELGAVINSLLALLGFAG